MDANELKFPFYTMQSEGDVFVKHLTANKCVKVCTWGNSINTIDYSGTTTTNEFDALVKNQAQIIPKERFDIERQEIIKQLINA